MNKFTNWIVGGNALVTLAILAILVLSGGSSMSSHGFGSTTQTGLASWAPANATAFVGPYGVESDSGFFDTAGAVSNFLGQLAFSSNTTTQGPTYDGVASTCTTATSTIFAFQNPYNATSTLTYLSLGGTQGTVTTDILVATSTTQYSPNLATSATSTLGANILNLAAVTNATQFFAVAGVTVGSGAGFTNPKGIPGTQSYQEVTLGPKDWVIGVSTSTTAANDNSNGITVPASCTYRALIIR